MLWPRIVYPCIGSMAWGDLNWPRPVHTPGYELAYDIIYPGCNLAQGGSREPAALALAGSTQGRSSPASLQYAADLGLATDWYSVFLILDPIWRFVVVIVY